MADNRKEYVVDINGLPHTMLLNDDDAKRYGNKAKLAKRAPAPQNKQAPAPSNKSGTTETK